MNKVKLFALACLVTSLVGCDKSTVPQPHNPTNNSPVVPTEPRLPESPGKPPTVSVEAPKLDESSIFTIEEDQLKVFPQNPYLNLVTKNQLLTLDSLKSFKEVRIQFQGLEKYSLNEADVYIDFYDKAGKSIFPFIQVSQALPLLEKTPNQIRLTLYGEFISNRAGSFLPDFNENDMNCHQIRLRVLLSDNTQAGDPIQIQFSTPIWVSAIN